MPQVPRDANGPVFAEPWQAQAFALAVALHQRGVFTWGEWASALSSAISAHPGESYYENWLDALEHMVVAKGVASQPVLTKLCQAWAEAAAATPHGQPIALGAEGLGAEGLGKETPQAWVCSSTLDQI